MLKKLDLMELNYMQPMVIYLTNSKKIFPIKDKTNMEEVSKIESDLL
jgi:hypothetical protein